MMPTAPTAQKRWYPLARGEELVARHIVRAQLLGQELALWRDDAGRANAWENRCPHRGVRLSIGVNDGQELRCRYHGWRYATGTGQCTFLPAHPAQKPAGSIKIRLFPMAEILGFVWVGIPGDAGAVPEAAPGIAGISAPQLPCGLAGGDVRGRSVTLRSLFVDAPAAMVAVALRAEAASDLVHWLQPVDHERTVIHAAVTDVAPHIDRRALLRQRHSRLLRVRDSAEEFHGRPP